ncbi:MAG: hypothetical protein RR416_01695 [Clostridia bacterium]
MDELVLWSKTLLSSYDILPKILQSIDQCNMHTALGSFSFNGDPMEIFEQIMNANKRKEALVNLYVITTKTLGMIKPRHRQVLELKLVKGMRFEKIAETIGSCNRTVFRRYALGIAEFSDKLSQQGYDDKWFESRFARDIFIGKFFEKIKEKSLFARLEEEMENEMDEEMEDSISIANTNEKANASTKANTNAKAKANTNEKANTNTKVNVNANTNTNEKDCINTKTKANTNDNNKENSIGNNQAEMQKKLRQNSQDTARENVAKVERAFENANANTNVLDKKNVVKDGADRSIKSRCDGHCGHGHSGCENCATA